jgi:hypothetical protein
MADNSASPAGRRLTFKNTSRARNAYLSANGKTNTINYSVQTKRENGQSSVSNSAARVEQALTPGNFTWTSGHSYANTYSNPSKAENAASRKSMLKLQAKYNSYWVDATVAQDTFEERAQEIEQSYYAKVAERLPAILGHEVDDDLAAVLLNFIGTMEGLIAGRKVKAEPMPAEGVLERKTIKATGLKKKQLTDLYNAFGDLRAAKAPLLKSAKGQLKAELAEIEAKLAAQRAASK